VSYISIAGVLGIQYSFMLESGRHHIWKRLALHVQCAAVIYVVGLLRNY
jgi:hypothetical protein